MTYARSRLDAFLDMFRKDTVLCTKDGYMRRYPASVFAKMTDEEKDSIKDSYVIPPKNMVIRITLKNGTTRADKIVVRTRWKVDPFSVITHPQYPYVLNYPYVCDGALQYDTQGSTINIPMSGIESWEVEDDVG